VKLINNTTEMKTVLDVGDGLGRTVQPGAAAEFTEQAARELRASFPSEWIAADVVQPMNLQKEGAK